jgi:nucleoid-associated protein YgaU
MKYAVAKMLSRYVVPPLAVAALTVGCAGRKDASASARPGVTEISPTPPIAYQSTAYQTPQIAQPVAPVQPVIETPAAVPAAGPAAHTAVAGGTSYTVQRGDTLFKIARDRYGDASAWKKIAAANPNVSNGAIKAGQRLVLP